MCLFPHNNVSSCLNLCVTFTGLTITDFNGLLTQKDDKDFLEYVILLTLFWVDETINEGDYIVNIPMVANLYITQGIIIKFNNNFT